MAEHIVAIFETAAAADAAVRDLEAAGISTAAIRRYQPRPGEGATTTSTSAGATTTSSGGFWAWLLGEEPQTGHSYYPRDEERYERGVSAGNAVVSVVVDASQIHQVVTILEAHRPLEMEEDTDESEVDLSAASLTTQSAGSAASAGSATQAYSPPTTGAGAVNASVGRASSPSGAEEVVQLAEEQIEVGKRTVDRGVTRIRRYVVERPVEQDVTLRGQRVTIERRRPVEVTGVPGQAFEERLVEVRETEEVPVVAKTARVVEEVAIRKEETERTETVRDTVRREEVEVTDEKGRPVSRPEGDEPTRS
jgi:uncharacterized protein (TIGR02271 family)